MDISELLKLEGKLLKRLSRARHDLAVLTGDSYGSQGAHGYRTRKADEICDNIRSLNKAIKEVEAEIKEVQTFVMPDDILEIAKEYK